MIPSRRAHSAVSEDRGADRALNDGRRRQDAPRLLAQAVVAPQDSRRRARPATAATPAPAPSVSGPVATPGAAMRSRGRAGASAGGIADLRIGFRRIHASESRRGTSPAGAEEALRRSAFQRDGRPRRLHRRLHEARPDRARRARAAHADGLRARRGHDAPSRRRAPKRVRRRSRPRPPCRRWRATILRRTRFLRLRRPFPRAARTRPPRLLRVTNRRCRDRDEPGRQEPPPLLVQRDDAARRAGARARTRARGHARREDDALPEGACGVRRWCGGRRRRRLHAGSAPVRRRRGGGRQDADDPLRQRARDRRVVGRSARRNAEDRGAARGRGPAGSRAGADRLVPLGRSAPDLRSRRRQHSTGRTCLRPSSR